MIVANPEGSADVSKLKLAFSTVMSRFNRNVTPDFDAGDPKPRYNTISIMNGDKLASTNDDPTFKEGVSFVNLDQPDPNATSADIGGYYFNRPLKGVAAQIDGIPYSIFFGPLINDGAKTTNPVHFGIVSVALADIPAVGQRNSLGENLQTMQVLPPEVTDIFTTTSLQPTEVWYSTAHGFNIDTDDEGNIYIALHEANKKNAESDMNTEEFRNLRVPTVVKTKYNTSTTTDKDFNIGGYTVETMPFSALKKYIEDRGGWFDTTNKNSAPIFDYYTVASTDRQ